MSWPRDHNITADETQQLLESPDFLHQGGCNISPLGDSGEKHTIPVQPWADIRQTQIERPSAKSWPVFFTNFEVMEDMERLRNYSGMKDARQCDDEMKWVTLGGVLDQEGNTPRKNYWNSNEVCRSVYDILPVLIPGFDHPTRQYMTLTGGEAGWRKCRNSLLPARCREHGFYPLSRKIPCAARQLSPCATTGESPPATMKTRHSQK